MPEPHPTGHHRPSSPLDGPSTATAAAAAADVALAHAVERTLSVWTDMTSRGQMSPQTRRAFGQLLDRYLRYTRSRGALTLSQATAELAEDFVHARGRTRHGLIADSATATLHHRRAVLRCFYRTLHELGLTDADPTRDLALPERTRTAIRPLDEDEATALRHAAEYVERPSRHAAAAALALSGGHTGEIGHIALGDLDAAADRVRMHGSTRTDPRWCPLDPWARRILTARAALLAARHINCPDTAQIPLAVSAQPAPDEQLQARACVALTDLLRRIGLGADPTVKPASLTAYAAVRLLDRTGRIEEVARRLGLRSLDRAADITGFAWKTSAGDQQDRGEVRGA